MIHEVDGDSRVYTCSELVRKTAGEVLPQATYICSGEVIRDYNRFEAALREVRSLLTDESKNDFDACFEALRVIAKALKKLG